MSLKERILKELVIRTPKQKMSIEVWKEIGHMFANYQDFDEAFDKAWKKVKNES